MTEKKPIDPFDLSEADLRAMAERVFGSLSGRSQESDHWSINEMPASQDRTPKKGIDLGQKGVSLGTSGESDEWAKVEERGISNKYWR